MCSREEEEEKKKRTGCISRHEDVRVAGKLITVELVNAPSPVERVQLPVHFVGTRG
jgi:hypothetical protein